MRFDLTFASRLRASLPQAWAWITSGEDISAELRPILRMSAPRGVASLEGLAFEPRRPLFRSGLHPLGMLPVDHYDLTLLELWLGIGFVEESPIKSMRQ
jgi:hypothetical protein